MKIDWIHLTFTVSGCVGLIVLNITQYAQEWVPASTLGGRLLFTLIFITSILFVTAGLGTIEEEEIN